MTDPRGASRGNKVVSVCAAVAAILVAVLAVVWFTRRDPQHGDVGEPGAALPTPPSRPSTSSTTTPPMTTTGRSATTVAPTTTRSVTGPCRTTRDASGLLEQYLPMGGQADLNDPQSLLAKGARPKPSDWVPQPQAGFDWNNDGSPDDLRYDPATRTVTVDWHSGRLEVSGVGRSDVIEKFDLGSVAIVHDVTGDGRLDLVVANFNTVGVLAGDGAASGSRTMAFLEIGADGAGWMNPPKTLLLGTYADGSPNVRELPLGGATVRPVWDITGDGILDFALDNLSPRSGASYYYAGKPCI